MRLRTFANCLVTFSLAFFVVAIFINVHTLWFQDPSGGSRGGVGVRLSVLNTVGLDLLHKVDLKQLKKKAPVYYHVKEVGNLKIRFHGKKFTKRQVPTSTTRKPERLCMTDVQIERQSDILRNNVKLACQRLMANGSITKSVDWKNFHSYRDILPRIYGPEYRHMASNREWWLDFYISDKLEAIFNSNPRSGAENVKNYLLSLNKSKVASESLELIERRNTTYLISKWTSYFKIAFVRDPLERLVSAWKGKLSSWNVTTPTYKWKGADIIRKLRQVLPTVSNQVIFSGPELTLTEFFIYLDSQYDAKLFDHHWRPQAYVVFPCEIGYDFMGTTDSSSCQLQFLARILTGLDKNQIPAAASHTKSYDIKQELRSVPKQLINRVLIKHYIIDYLLFGFQLPAQLQGLYGK